MRQTGVFIIGFYRFRGPQTEAPSSHGKWGGGWWSGHNFHALPPGGGRMPWVGQSERSRICQVTDWGSGFKLYRCAITNFSIYYLLKTFTETAKCKRAINKHFK